MLPIREPQQNNVYNTPGYPTMLPDNEQLKRKTTHTKYNSGILNAASTIIMNCISILFYKVV